ncbi:MAG: hypothetical protein IAI48_18835 [Candidatus Eremiobacteraeota bacterium]|nr:hypothetical protein [Candidatus Eremiobacteraeota bacterium]
MSVRIGAIAVGLLAFGAPALAAPNGCVARLTDVRSGSGSKSFASHYVTDGSYGYGEFVAAGFGGQSLWMRRDAGWCRMPTGGATLDRANIIRFGVPDAVATRLVQKMRAGRGELAPPTPSPAPRPLRVPHR